VKHTCKLSLGYGHHAAAYLQSVGPLVSVIGYDTGARKKVGNSGNSNAAVDCQAVACSSRCAKPIYHFVVNAVGRRHALPSIRPSGALRK